MAGCHQYGVMRQDGTVHTDHIVALLHVFAPPVFLEVALEFHPHGTVVPATIQTTIYFSCLEDETPPFAEAHDFLHSGGICIGSVCHDNIYNWVGYAGCIDDRNQRPVKAKSVSSQEFQGRGTSLSSWESYPASTSVRKASIASGVTGCSVEKPRLGYSSIRWKSPTMAETTSSRGSSGVKYSRKVTGGELTATCASGHWAWSVASVRRSMYGFAGQ